jgi:hypothetical protein
MTQARKSKTRDTESVGSKPFFKNAALILAIVSLLANVALAVVNVLLWEETRESRRIAENVYNAANRPYLGSDGVRSQVNPDGSFAFTSSIKNFGTAPALDIQYRFDGTLNGNPLGHAGGYRAESTGVIFPGQIVLVPAVASKQEAGDIFSHKSQLFFTIDASYSDALGIHHAFHLKTHFDPAVNDFEVLGISTN